MAGLFASTPQASAATPSGSWFEVPNSPWPGTDRPPSVEPAAASVNVNNSTRMPRISARRGPDVGAATTTTPVAAAKAEELPATKRVQGHFSPKQIASIRYQTGLSEKTIKAIAKDMTNEETEMFLNPLPSRAELEAVDMYGNPITSAERRK